MEATSIWIDYPIETATTAYIIEKHRDISISIRICHKSLSDPHTVDFESPRSVVENDIFLLQISTRLRPKSAAT